MPPGDWTDEAEELWTQAITDANLNGSIHATQVANIRRKITHWASAVGTSQKQKEFEHPYETGLFGAVAKNGYATHVFYNK
jgi:hypothetical protein